MEEEGEMESKIKEALQSLVIVVPIAAILYFGLCYGIQRQTTVKIRNIDRYSGRIQTDKGEFIYAINTGKRELAPDLRTGEKYVITYRGEPLIFNRYANKALPTK
ncbi:hypothetical protein HY486_04570 [Candidatus Woesearchaeota archaeon]|nr:hypothetical protein [Candidatus Woesearchaeota archaeon]